MQFTCVFCNRSAVQLPRSADCCGKDQESIPHLTQDTTWESDKNTIIHHKREPRGQPFSSRLKTRIYSGGFGGALGASAPPVSSLHHQLHESIVKRQWLEVRIRTPSPPG